MELKKLISLGLASLFISVLHSNMAFADNPFGEFLQIRTNFTSVQGNPTWLIILRDVDTGTILPYLYDIRSNDNFWIAFSGSHNYRITVSNLQYDDDTVVHNFCRLENGIIKGKSMVINVTGKLSKRSKNSSCRVIKYSDLPFPVANQRDST